MTKFNEECGLDPVGCPLKKKAAKKENKSCKKTFNEEAGLDPLGCPLKE